MMTGLNNDPHRLNPEVHYRLFKTWPNGEPGVICVQDFDYLDLDESRFLSPDAWDTEKEAEKALEAFKGTRIAEAFETLKWLSR